jgi:zinc transport system substrate-binding protein
MLWEAEPSAENRRRLAALGVQSAVYDPAANRPDTGDWLDVMAANAGQLRQVFGQ